MSLVAGGELERIAGCSRFAVSSLHSQGVKRLAPGLVAAAHADDGLVEAFRWHDNRQFAWAFQFHPERGHGRHPYYATIMNAFVEACWERLRSPDRRVMAGKRWRALSATVHSDVLQGRVARISDDCPRRCPTWRKSP